MHDDFLTGDELAGWLQVPRRTIDSWRYHGDGPPGYKIGRHVRYPESEVIDWIRQMEQAHDK